MLNMCKWHQEFKHYPQTKFSDNANENENETKLTFDAGRAQQICKLIAGWDLIGNEDRNGTRTRTRTSTMAMAMARSESRPPHLVGLKTSID